MSFLQSIGRRGAGLIGRESRLIRRLRPAYESFLERSSGDKGIRWPINGVEYRIDPHHRHRMGQNYDVPVAEFLRERVRPGATCIDVGANVGVYVLQFAHWSGPDGRVVAFEPNPSALAVLRKHVRINDLTERVTIAPLAVGEANCDAILYAAEADGMSRLGAPNAALAESVSEITVPVVSLDSYCKIESLVPDWLLIDIEGFEIAALSGARELIQSQRGKLGIVVEMHPNVWDSANTTRRGAEELLEELGLRAVPLAGQSDALGEHGIVWLEWV